MLEVPTIPLIRLNTRESKRQLNFHQLYIFYAVASHNSFSRAAEAMEITQPAVSIQIQELEKSLGATLFHRRSRGLRVTDVGETVYNYAQQIFGLSSKMLESIGEIQDVQTGRLILGASSNPGEFVLPDAIGKFRQVHPGIQVEMYVGDTGSIVQSILNQEMDIGMVGMQPRNNADELETIDYASDEIVMVAAPDHRIAQESRVTAAQIAEHGLILRGPASETGKAAEQWLADKGASPHIVLHLGSNQAVKQATIAGGGVGVVSRRGVIAEVKAGMLKILDVEGWDYHRPIIVAYHKGRHLSPSQKTFLSFLEANPPA